MSNSSDSGLATPAQLAQINIGTMRAPVDDPMVAEFMDNLERINALADSAEGFVWRLQTESGNATSIQVFANPLELLNMSVWESVETLKAYVYQSGHVDFFRRRAEWFEADAKRVALWWVPQGHIPDPAEGIHRVEFLEKHGPSPYAFGFLRSPAVLLFEETTLEDPETARLVQSLNAELAAVATHPSENHFSLSTEEITGTNGRMLRARYNGELVACGAVRRIGDTTSELKRMYVNEQVRGLKLGAAMLDQLETVATQLGMTELKLETGPHQVAALGLYERAGFVSCALWGDYLHSPETSLCFSKML
jgi:ribosomal protein S18 acetylase RimI-like enzyme